MELQDRHVVVTGAAGNLGSEVCRMLIAAGAKVCALGHAQKALDELCEGIEASARESSLMCLVADLTRPKELSQALDVAEGRFGPIWGVLCAAGGWKGGSTVSNTPDEVFQAMVAINLTTTFNTCREVMRRMEAAQKGGRVVTVGALAAASGRGGANSGAYTASKAAVIALSRVLAEEGASHGVLVNCVAPETLRTPQNEAAMPHADHSRWVPLGQAALSICLLLSPRLGAATGGFLPFPNRP